mgnify:CR=1 FL=1
MSIDSSNGHVRKAIVFLAIMAASVLFMSSPVSGREKKDTGFQLRKYEFSLGAGVASALHGSFVNYIGDPGSISDIYQNAEYYDRKRYTSSFTFNFVYNFTKVLAIQTGVSYYGGSWTFFRRESGSDYGGYKSGKDKVLLDNRINYLVPMVTLRVSWLNRKLVRLYSSVGLGLEIPFAQKCGFDTNDPRYYMVAHSGFTLAAQLCFVGISVGKNVYGFFETGVGNLYSGCCAGVGYRF